MWFESEAQKLSGPRRVGGFGVVRVIAKEKVASRGKGREKEQRSREMRGNRRREGSKEGTQSQSREDPLLDSIPYSRPKVSCVTANHLVAGHDGKNAITQNRGATYASPSSSEPSSLLLPRRLPDFFAGAFFTAVPLAGASCFLDDDGSGVGDLNSARSESSPSEASLPARRRSSSSRSDIIVCKSSV